MLERALAIGSGTAAGSPRAAVPMLERALAIGSGEGVNPYASAEAKFVLVQALWEADRLRDRAAAAVLRTLVDLERRFLQRAAEQAA
jgi:hypothetical protein